MHVDRVKFSITALSVSENKEIQPMYSNLNNCALYSFSILCGLAFFILHVPFTTSCCQQFGFHFSEFSVKSLLQQLPDSNIGCSSTYIQVMIHYFWFLKVYMILIKFICEPSVLD